MSSVAMNDRQRAAYGAIYQHFGVSPHPTGAMAMDPTLRATDPAPTFSWDPQNNGASETFNLDIWSANFGARLLDNFAVPLADGNSYSLSAMQWATVDAMPGIKEFVVIGSDLVAPDGSNYTDLAATGGYWSDAYPFTIAAAAAVSGPSGLVVVLSGGFGILLLRRARMRSAA